MPITMMMSRSNVTDGRLENPSGSLCGVAPSMSVKKEKSVLFNWRRIHGKYRVEGGGGGEGEAGSGRRGDPLPRLQVESDERNIGGRKSDVASVLPLRLTSKLSKPPFGKADCLLIFRS